MTVRSLEERLARARSLLQEEGVGALVSFGAADCRYLTGFTGKAAAVVLTGSELILVSDSRFTVQAAEEAPEARFVLTGDAGDDLIAEILSEGALGKSDGLAVAGFEPDHLTVKRWEHLRPLLESGGSVRWKLIGGLVERCRRVKFSDELEAMRLAGQMAAQAFAYLETMPVVGRSERDVALELEVFLRRQGSEGAAFPFIVAAGPRGAMPHAEASPAVVEPGGLLILDIGAVVDGYASDMTRTYATGEVDPDLVRTYELVREAQALAVAAIRPGVSGREVDGVARNRFQAEDMADLFVHSLGHGVGLEVHEGPNLSSRSDDVLEVGMVVTVEPGLYLPGRAGIRIEDTVIVTPEGAEILTEWPRGLRTLS
ncbi:MAG: aminopeptidase P family protein [bacterium]